MIKKSSSAKILFNRTKTVLMLCGVSVEKHQTGRGQTDVWP